LRKPFDIEHFARPESDRRRRRARRGCRLAIAPARSAYS
jgi:hypothetical protein